MRPAEAVPALFILLLAVGIYVGTSDLRLWDGPTPGARFFSPSRLLASLR